MKNLVVGKSTLTMKVRVQVFLMIQVMLLETVPDREDCGDE
jgi:hypothetical protein